MDPSGKRPRLAAVAPKVCARGAFVRKGWCRQRAAAVVWPITAARSEPAEDRHQIVSRHLDDAFEHETARRIGHILKIAQPIFGAQSLEPKLELLVRRRGG